MARPASIGNAHESRKGNELGEQRGAPGYAVNGKSKWTRQAASGGNVDTKPSHRERASWSKLDLMVKHEQEVVARLERQVAEAKARGDTEQAARIIIRLQKTRVLLARLQREQRELAS